MRISELYEENEEGLDDQEQDKPESEDDVPSQYSDTAEIRADIFPELEKKINGLNKRATKAGSPPITMTKVREFFKKENTKGREREEKFYEIKIEGQAPRIEGYKFVATIQHMAAGNVLRSVPGYGDTERLQRFYDAHPDYCDYCKKKRRRIDTFIIEEEKTGELRQVGRNCLKDFLGGIDPKRILFFFSLRDHIAKAIHKATQTATSSRVGTEGYIPNREVLCAAAAAIRNYGYLSSRNKQTGESNPNSTAARVRNILWDDEKEFGKDGLPLRPIDLDIKAAEEVVDWFKALPQQYKDSSEFTHNVDVLIKNERCTYRDIGYLVALFPMYYREVEKKKTQNQPTVQKPTSSEWVGAVGQKIGPIPVTIKRLNIIHNNFGRTQLIAMDDNNGNRITWFNSNPADYEVGQQFNLSGTVKKMDEFRGQKQTIVTRAKLQRQ